MCGIFSLLNCHESINYEMITNEFIKGSRRGPEFSKLETVYSQIILGFHRLAINGLNDLSNQPICIKDITLVCNGEIYNYKELYSVMNVKPVTDSDCEVIIHLYLKYGIEQTLTMLDGVFAFVLYDKRIIDNLDNRVYVARDPYGVRPLYVLKNEDSLSKNSMYGFASELKCLELFYNNINNINNTYSLTQFSPGTYSVYSLTTQVLSTWKSLTENVPYFIPSFSYTNNKNKNYLEMLDRYLKNISTYLQSAVEKRCITTERPIACLLSGGLDSSLIAALVSDYYKKNNIEQRLETYSIGLQNSEDLKYAKQVADYIGSNHTEVVVTEQEMFDIIPELIATIESYDTTTVRASIGNYLLGKYITENSSAKVIFNGDGSDELFGGYLYMDKCPDDVEFDRETRRLLKDIHLFDVLRSDKSISSNGLEPRTPFLDKTFANYVLSIPPFFRNHNNNSYVEKYLLRMSFTSEYFKNANGQQILPDSVLWRKKEAFSDGVTSQGRSLFWILQEKIALKEGVEPSIESEKKYYKDIFDAVYPNCDKIVPYFWMPKYIDAKDPSARTLTFYNK
jgi:asparagine synthase (glutamine-hydrolysing)